MLNYKNSKKLYNKIIGTLEVNAEALLLGSYKNNKDIDVYVPNLFKAYVLVTKLCESLNILIVFKKIHRDGIRLNLLQTSESSCNYLMLDIYSFPLIKKNIKVNKKTFVTLLNFYRLLSDDKKFNRQSLENFTQRITNTNDLFFALEKYSAMLCKKSRVIIENNDVKGLINDHQSLAFCFRPRLYYAKALAWNLFRFFYALKNPPGLIVAFYGPDGSGKSTLSRKFLNNSTYTGFHLFHLFREINIKKNSNKEADKNQEPYLKKSHNMFFSLLKIIMFWFKFLNIFFSKVFLYKLRGHLIVFDRYFDDIFLDHKRYRYKPFFPLEKLLYFLLPRPDIIFILNANFSVISQRKMELSRLQLSRLNRTYTGYCIGKKYAHMIDVSGSEAQTVRKIENCYIQYIKNKMDHAQ